MVRYSAFALFIGLLVAAAPDGLNNARAAGNAREGAINAERRQAEAMQRPAQRPVPSDGTVRPLDLSLPPHALKPTETPAPTDAPLYRGLPGLENIPGQNDAIGAMRQALPGLLDPQNNDNPVRLKGRLLMDQAKERSHRAVDGGQLIIEVQTD